MSGPALLEGFRILPRRLWDLSTDVTPTMPLPAFPALTRRIPGFPLPGRLWRRRLVSHWDRENEKITSGASQDPKPPGAPRALRPYLYLVSRPMNCTMQRRVITVGTRE